jgi:hypothetical protein
MTQTVAAADKKKGAYNSHDDQVLDTTHMKPADDSAKGSDITSISEIAS